MHLFYDFEVFKYDWLVVLACPETKQEFVIVNDRQKLEKLYLEHIEDIFIGYNCTHYDQYIFKGILLGFNPKEINDYIIVEDKPGWSFSSEFYRVPLNTYDIMEFNDGGLKFLEGCMGISIKESSISFDIDRPLTKEEIEETIKYCEHDVMSTMLVFQQRYDTFDTTISLVNMIYDNGCTQRELINKTSSQLTAILLNAKRCNFNDEFDFTFPENLQLGKYEYIKEWYKNPDNKCYNKYSTSKSGTPIKHVNQLITTVGGIEHVYGFGGVHAARPKYHGEGIYLNMDVASLYPSTMIEYNLHSRAMKDPQDYVRIYKQRLEYKKAKNPKQKPLKLVLNKTYGIMKDQTSKMYDPRQSNMVCLYGQLFITDLIEKIENYCEIIQSNTDGVLVKCKDQETVSKVKAIAHKWELRTRYQLEFDEYTKIVQKDVNNYVIVAKDGHYKAKGVDLKDVSSEEYNKAQGKDTVLVKYDCFIVELALINYFVRNIPISETIMNDNELIHFQILKKISSKFENIKHGDKVLNEKCVRVFASKNESDGNLEEFNKAKQKYQKLPSTPEHAFIINDDIHGMAIPQQLDRQWYINKAMSKLSDFGF